MEKEIIISKNDFKEYFNNRRIISVKELEKYYKTKFGCIKTALKQ